MTSFGSPYYFVLVGGIALTAIAHVLLKWALSVGNNRPKWVSLGLTGFSFMLFFLVTLLCTIALKKIPLKVATPLLGMVYPITVCLGACLLGERWTWKVKIGSGLILLGIIISQFGN